MGLLLNFPEPCDRVTQLEKQCDVRRALRLAPLTSRERESVRLEMDEATYAEAAEELNLSRYVAHRVLRDACRTLSEQLQGYERSHECWRRTARANIWGRRQRVNAKQREKARQRKERAMLEGAAAQ